MAKRVGVAKLLHTVNHKIAISSGKLYHWFVLPARVLPIIPDKFFESNNPLPIKTILTLIFSIFQVLTTVHLVLRLEAARSARLASYPRPRRGLVPMAVDLSSHYGQSIWQVDATKRCFTRGSIDRVLSIPRPL